MAYGYETGVYAAVMAVIGIVLVFALVIYILQVIGMWKVFKKSGEEGWKAIIPIYNQYTMCKITGVNPWWVLIVVVASGLTGALGESDLASVVSLLSSISSFIESLSCISSLSLSSFNLFCSSFLISVVSFISFGGLVSIYLYFK